MKILIADDDVVSRRMVQQVLERAGYEVTQTSEGNAAAAELCHPNGPRMALLDWMMPGMDGPSVCQEVRRRREQPYVYLLLLTTRDDKEDVVAGLEAGADDYLKKPVHPAELLARLRTGRRILRLEDKLIRARDEMRFKATHDSLTSLWNRDFIFGVMDREIARARRQRTPVSLLICDLDHFKSVNDNYGHLVGDEVLREAARRILGCVRAYDSVGRYGGEEFLLVLTGCNAADTRKRAEHIRMAFGQTPFPTEKGPLKVTISIGVVCTDDFGFLGGEELLREADAALYEAKLSGRNRVGVAHPRTPPAPERRYSALADR